MSNKIIEKEVNIMLIGCGHHARRIYVPYIIEASKTRPVKICAVIDVLSEKTKIKDVLNNLGVHAETIFIEDSNSPDTDLHEELVRKMNLLVSTLNINAVIISTDPLYHSAYAKWALENKLHILMDKPISTRLNALTISSQAKGIFEDYTKLLSIYNNIQTEKETIFSIMTQRRYDPFFRKVLELVSDASERFNIPVTSIQAMHADGVWIFPDEIIEQIHHSYNNGNGKCSHSGYHIFDMVWQIYSAGMRKNKLPQFGEVVTSFVQPVGLIEQFSQDDYRKLFGSKYDDINRRDQDLLKTIMNDYGENDAFSIVKLLKGDINICNISINLLHNSFSRRFSLTPAIDLYKSNGRVKHQSFTIQQGPFQCIQIHNYQSKSEHNRSIADESQLGGNNHFEIFVFRNSVFFGKDVPPLEVIKSDDLNIKPLLNESGLDSESPKYAVIIEFIDFILGKKDKKNLVSNIDTHEIPVKLMSAIYHSHSNQHNATGNPLVKFSL